MHKGGIIILKGDPVYCKIHTDPGAIVSLLYIPATIPELAYLRNIKLDTLPWGPQIVNISQYHLRFLEKGSKQLSSIIMGGELAANPKPTPSFWDRKHPLIIAARELRGILREYNAETFTPFIYLDRAPGDSPGNT